MDVDMDYNYKIQLFQDITGCNDGDTAFNFLMECDWDEQLASQVYLSSINANKPNSEEIKPKKVEDKKIKSNIDIQENNDMYYQLMDVLQLKKEASFSSFKASIISKMGLLIIYSENDVEILSDIIFQLSDNENIMEILKSNYSIFMISNTNKDIKSFIEKHKLNGLSPITLFVHDPEMNFEKSSVVISKIEGFLEYNFLCEKIKENSYNISKFGPKKIPNNDFNYDNQKYINEPKLTNVELMEKQKKELEEMEKRAYELEMQKKKEEELKRKKEDEIKHGKEMLKKKISNEKRCRESFKSKLYIEPESSNPDSCLIIFRLPNGNRIERRFLKKWKIEQMYYFINTVENVFVDEDSTDFDIITPFPMKIYDDFEVTFESAGLGSNSVLQIRER